MCVCLTEHKDAQCKFLPGGHSPGFPLKPCRQKKLGPNMEQRCTGWQSQNPINLNSPYTYMDLICKSLVIELSLVISILYPLGQLALKIG